MFKFRTPVMLDADDGGGGGGEVVAPGADPTLGAPSPTEQTFEGPKDFRSAREAFMQSAPPIIEQPDPAPAPEPDPLVSAVDDLGAPPAAPAPAPAAPVTAATPQPSPYAGREAEVDQALQVMDALRTEAGVRAMIAQGAVALGYSPEQIRAAFGEQQPVAGAPESAPAAPAALDALANLPDDELVMGKDIKSIVNAAVQQAVAQATAATTQQLQQTVDPVRQAFEQQQRTNAQATADATYVELLGPTPPVGDPNRDGWLAQAKAVQAAASSHLAPDNWNPADIRAALLRGHVEFVAHEDALLKAYAQGKKRDREAQPTSINGGAVTGSDPPKEPQNLAESRAQARAGGFFQ